MFMARNDKGRELQADMFSWVSRVAREIGKRVVIHCLGIEGTAKESLGIMKENLPRDQINGALTPFQ